MRWFVKLISTVMIWPISPSGTGPCPTTRSREDNPVIVGHLRTGAGFGGSEDGLAASGSTGDDAPSSEGDAGLGAGLGGGFLVVASAPGVTVVVAVTVTA
ncbi:hypothetical protein [Terracoccus luteus]|uniref:Uncharacterized protein n=1 Tax=Terracoccus luteus TaxID=53356 RepID=A0A839PY62_9MICO|nr:hypothetical protein [Terracoccus luteus]MBB2988467.1 hypothetical protein [Terracoccus luteus]MCP2174078.1 hypothetical protein [Terracoccus luteus]